MCLAVHRRACRPLMRPRYLARVLWGIVEVVEARTPGVADVRGDAGRIPAITPRSPPPSPHPSAPALAEMEEQRRGRPCDYGKQVSAQLESMMLRSSTLTTPSSLMSPGRQGAAASARISAAVSARL